MTRLWSPGLNLVKSIAKFREPMYVYSDDHKLLYYIRADCLEVNIVCVDLQSSTIAPLS